MKLKFGHYYEVCERCSTIVELDRDKDLIFFDGPHNNCTEKGRHAHNRTPFTLCNRCQKIEVIK